MNSIEKLRAEVEAARLDWKKKLIPKNHKGDITCPLKTIAVYGALNPNDELYVGESVNIRERTAVHQGGYVENSNTELTRSIAKYGWKAHQWRYLLRLPAQITNVLSHDELKEKLRFFETLFINHFVKEGVKMMNKNKVWVPLEIKGTKSITRQAVPIGQYTMKGELIQIWPSMLKASRELNISQGNISMCVNGTVREDHAVVKSAGGFLWRRM